MDQPQTGIRSSFFRLFSFTDRSPEQLLLHTVEATIVLLVGAALFDHTPLPLVPAGILIFGWRKYHNRHKTD
jgi:hypothetical protein